MAEKFEQFCIVELFGHQVIAGKVTEQTIGGQSFIRVDVPEFEGNPAFTKLYGTGSIYCMTPCDEQTAKAAVEAMQVNPINIYQLRLPRPSEPEDPEF